MAAQAVQLSDARQATYEVVGEGRPTLMLPGGPGFAAEYMRGDAELFSDVLQSYLIDPHGSGGSTPPADPTHYSPEGHASFYEDTRSALGLGRVVVFGHSFGATTALTYAALYPESVTACIAVAPFGVGIEADRGRRSGRRCRDGGHDGPTSRGALVPGGRRGVGELDRARAGHG